MEIEILKERIQVLEDFIKSLANYSSIPLEIDQAFRKRFGIVSLNTVINGGTGVATITGILKGNGISPFTSITPLAGSKIYYVADSSGGAVTRKLSFTDGVLTSET